MLESVPELCRLPSVTEPVRVTLQVLRVLDALLQESPAGRYGYELTAVTGVASGTLYPILARLESAGWLASEWEASPEHGKPPRRYYRLTGEGASAARLQLANAPGVHRQQTAPSAKGRRIARPAMGYGS